MPENQVSNGIPGDIPIVRQTINGGRVCIGVVLVALFLGVGVGGGYWYSQQVTQEKMFKMCIQLSPEGVIVRQEATDSATPTGR